jgi:tRNA(fMet)-specific endonuclease VapC
MIALDSDILSLMALGNIEIGERLKDIDPRELAVPIIVLEEKLRGRLNTIRQAEAGKTKISLTVAYQFLETGWKGLQNFPILSFTEAAEERFEVLRSTKLRIGTQDRRIAATCIVHAATLVTRNRRDFEKIPGLTVEFW